MTGYFRDAGSFEVSSGGDVVRVFVVGPIQTNCYAYVSAGEALIVDPGAAGVRVAAALSGEKVVCVVGTHGHGDHVGGVAALVSATGAPFELAAPDVEMAEHASNPRHSGSGVSYDNDAPAPSRLLVEGDVVKVGTAQFRVMETPGHTPGGICLVGEGTADGIAFVGDTLFPGSCGRTDLDGGDPDAMRQSLSRMGREIAPKTVLLCGHGPATTMAEELENNPFVQ
ncbi:MBL fold metallo-hydrolase [Olsenella sp. Marseille-P4559]|uniref:MBL fold metallo-hydrolase n=1 Tax=Olsenella sp. Marseille-P4559 TaxID=2364795 RepID=UPI00102F5B53|nr:MBL fold metallo-hydrolase [Olsenella sp. Marseille-P4559]